MLVQSFDHLASDGAARPAAGLRRRRRMALISGVSSCTELVVRILPVDS